MKLQYYMRGLGMGIIVTALVMGLVGNKSRPLTDAEIRELALKIGMVDGDSLKLSDVQPTEGPEENPGGSFGSAGNNSGSGEPSETGAPETEGSEESESVPEDGEAPSGSGEPSETGAPETEGSEESESVPEDGEVPSGSETDENSGEGVTIVIEPGVGSRAVCGLLEDAGLVEDAAALDRYICDNGLSKKIRMGTYTILPGTDEEEIVRIITKTQN